MKHSVENPRTSVSSRWAAGADRSMSSAWNDSMRGGRRVHLRRACATGALGIRAGVETLSARSSSRCPWDSDLGVKYGADQLSYPF